ncbi:MAG: helix-turn-helix transcriptional regulator [Clostridia bacterium]|nr:helix-turn-helix transcriptional regulator [Clostridia bacterium]
MHYIGQTISRLRRERNMTQMQLADEMNVSFQAVSNWERGQSMPDIAKLPALSEFFGVTIDELLGREIPLVKMAAKGKLEEYMAQTPLTVEEAAEAAPLLQPDQMEHITDRLMGLQHADGMPGDAESFLPEKLPENLPDMTALLPFMRTEKVDALIRQRAKYGQSITAFAPFASTAMVESIARDMEAQGLPTVSLAPFMSTRAVDDIAKARMEAGRGFIELAPFMSAPLLEQLARELTDRGEGIASLAPFLNTQTLDDIALTRLRSGQSINDILPFISNRLIERLFEAAAKQK